MIHSIWNRQIKYIGKRPMNCSPLLSSTFLGGMSITVRTQVPIVCMFVNYFIRPPPPPQNEKRKRTRKKQASALLNLTNENKMFSFSLFQQLDVGGFDLSLCKELDNLILFFSQYLVHQLVTLPGTIYQYMTKP